MRLSCFVILFEFMKTVTNCIIKVKSIDVEYFVEFRTEEIIMKVPHLVQYQGSKRIIAPEAIKLLVQ